MGVNFDCNLFWTVDRRALLGALSILPEFLRSAQAESGAVIDYRDWQILLGRRMRALKLCSRSAARASSVPGDDPPHVALTRTRRWVADDDRFRVVAPHR
jgi:aromatic-L-amino-acid decarboxylase